MTVQYEWPEADLLVTVSVSPKGEQVSVSRLDGSSFLRECDFSSRSSVNCGFRSVDSRRLWLEHRPGAIAFLELEATFHDGLRPQPAFLELDRRDGQLVPYVMVGFRERKQAA